MSVGYQMFWHGPFAETMGEHLNFGVYDASSHKKYLHFNKDGKTANSTGVYSTVVRMPILWSARQECTSFEDNRDPKRLDEALHGLR